MSATALLGGFDEAPAQSARAFRAIMQAMARPGTVWPVDGAAPPAPLSPAAGAVLLTLCDADTPVYLAGAAECDDVRQWLAFHCSAPVTGPAQAQFAVGTWAALQPLDPYAIGTSEYPDRSVTLIVDGHDFDAPPHRLQGPGIRHEAALPLPDTGLAARNARTFPLGIDLILTAGDRLAAVPRTTRVV